MWQRCSPANIGATSLLSAGWPHEHRCGIDVVGGAPGSRRPTIGGTSMRLEGRGHDRFMSDSAASAETFRTEHDSMGEVRVPAEALWGAQTERARAHAVSGERMPREVIIALARIKSAAAAVNTELGVIDADVARAIQDAAREIAIGEFGDGGHFEHFPLDVFQTGSGTSTNMNANEVIATLAARRLGRPVHPNDHVNASQSSNDVFPSAVHNATARALSALIRALDHLASTLEDKAAQFTEALDHFEAAGARDALVAASGVARIIAVSLYKICNDLRLMGSGPRTGLAEISIPELQPGLSIMPGKVNPVICEMVCEACAQVMGNDGAIGFAGAAGNFELNVMVPVIARNLLGSANLLMTGASLLADRCVAGIGADPARLRRLAESSPAIVTTLNRFIGYEAAAAVAHQALATGQTIREVVVARGHVELGEITEAELDEALDVLAMTRPRLPEIPPAMRNVTSVSTSHGLPRRPTRCTESRTAP